MDPSQWRCVMVNKEIIFVVMCPDQRFWNCHRLFIEDHLGLQPGTFVILTVLGGASVLARPDEFESSFNSILDEIRFLLEENPGATYRLVLINHEDCKRAKNTEDQAIADLQEAAKNARTLLLESYKGTISLHYGMLDQSNLIFKDIPLKQHEVVTAASE